MTPMALTAPRTILATETSRMSAFPLRLPGAEDGGPGHGVTWVALRSRAAEVILVVALVEPVAPAVVAQARRPVGPGADPGSAGNPVMIFGGREIAPPRPRRRRGASARSGPPGRPVTANWTRWPASGWPSGATPTGASWRGLPRLAPVTRASLARCCTRPTTWPRVRLPAPGGSRRIRGKLPRIHGQPAMITRRCRRPRTRCHRGTPPRMRGHGKRPIGRPPGAGLRGQRGPGFGVPGAGALTSQRAQTGPRVQPPGRVSPCLARVPAPSPACGQGWLLRWRGRGRP
jgi:hypothetical protein